MIGNVLAALLVYGVITPETIKSSDMYALLSAVVISSVIYVYAFILDTVVPAGWKDSLVYAITGKPGNTIFSDIKEKDMDDRFTREEARKKYKDVYQKIDEASSDKERHRIENASWDSIYRKYQDKGAVYMAHRDFLLNRDMSFITLDMIVAYFVFSVLLGEISFQWSYLIFLLSEFVVTNLAAKWRVKRFVLNVIAADIHKE